MGQFSFLFVLLAASTILPSGLALPRGSSDNCTQTYPHGIPTPPSLSLSLPLPTKSRAPGSVKNHPSPVSKPKSSTPPLATPTPKLQASSASTSSTSASDIKAFLDAHNNFRAQHGAAPLVWNDLLASKAQQWASNCRFEHSGGQLGNFGENLAAGTGSGFDIAAAVKMWTDEASSYDPNNPVYSHFTQVVWKSSTDLGCVLHVCNNDNIFNLAEFGPTNFVVCEYSPPGNVIGEFSQNVQV